MKALFKRIVRGKKLVGAGAIEDFLSLSPASLDLHDLIIGYEIPVHKEDGKLVAYKNELLAWQANHPDIIEMFWKKHDDSLQPREITQTRIVKTKWGLERVETRKVIF